jgi:hypothetical protein
MNFIQYCRGLRMPLVFSYVLATVLMPAISSHAQLSVHIGTNFTSSTYGVDTLAIPADSNGAIGPNHFMEFINGTVAAYNKTNGNRNLRESDLSFWSKAGVSIPSTFEVTDPTVIYDPLSQRWFATMVDADASAPSGDPTTEANDFLLAVSKTSDPSKGWTGFLFQSDPDNSTFADFPRLGVDSNAVYISGDFFSSSVPVGSGLVSIPKADLLLATPTVDNRTWYGVMAYTNRGTVLQPVTCFDGSSSGNILSVEDYGFTSDPHSNLVTFAVLNSGTTNASLTASTDIRVLPYMVPDNALVGAPTLVASQPGGTGVQANDARISARVYAVNGVIYAVHNTQSGSHIAIRWYRINATTHALIEMGTISDPNLDLFFPSIAANASGTVLICCNSTGPGTFVSSVAYAGQTVNGVTTFGNQILLQSGVITYDGDDEQLGISPISRWGDYSATSVDPGDSTRFWTIQMFPSDPVNNDVWSTQITELTITQPASPPRLSIASAGSNVKLSWPSSATGFALQNATNLPAGTNWSAVVATLVTNGGTISATVPIPGNRNFYRLKQGP